MKRVGAGLALLVVLVAAFLWSRPEPAPPSAPPAAHRDFSSAGLAAKSVADGASGAASMRDKRFYLSQGMTKEALKNRKGALQDYNTAITMDPKFADAYFQRGTLKAEMKDCRGSEKDLKKAATLNKTLAPQIPYYLSKCR